jgi:DNA-binding transcriptional ArsR family regulator
MSERPEASDAEVRLSDPRAMRALAHPTRLRILDYLYQHGPATATQCAAIVGESPSDCSYHLRTLAKWGFVEGLPARGRQRPWRPVARTIKWAMHEENANQYGEATSALLREVVLQDEERLEQYLLHEADFPEPWRQTVDFASATAYLTLPELIELKERYHDLIREYLPRTDGPQRDGSRRVQLIFRTIPAVNGAPQS